MNRRSFVAILLAAGALATVRVRAQATAGKPRVLLIGLDPRKLDGAQPLLDPKLTPQMVMEGVQRDQRRMAQLGYVVEECMDAAEVLVSAAKAKLQSGRFDVIVIGAGIRLNPAYFSLFEQLVDQVHRLAPGAHIAFNTRPDDSTEAIQRALATPVARHGGG